jgi:undecaprenyl diphosphate synthase
MVESNSKIQHVAIIMDGNGRWAEKHNLHRIEGHRKGAEVVKTAIEACSELEIKYLTLYAFSTENWKRSQNEIDALMELLEEFIDTNLEEFNNKNIRLKTIGRIDEFPDSTVKKLKKAISMTADNTSGTVVLALNYGGRAEIVDTVKKIGRKLIDKELDIDDITEELFSANLYDPELPDPDIMIRTSGEFRLSNFLLWELSYSEIYISEVLWPDFTKEEFIKAVDSLNNRERRFGGRLNK